MPLVASAGTSLTTGSGNIYINANAATAAEATTTRIGTSQTKAFIAGIRGVTSIGDGYSCCCSVANLVHYIITESSNITYKIWVIICKHT